MAEKTTLDKYVEYLSGYADLETSEEIRRQLEDPDSEASRFYRDMAERTRDPFGLGRPLFPPDEVWEEVPVRGELKDSGADRPRD